MAATHKRNTTAMRPTLRCGAMTRRGRACQSPAVSGKAHCRMHGSATRSGAPEGNQNAFKHRKYTAEQLALAKHVRKLIREGSKLIEES